MADDDDPAAEFDDDPTRLDERGPLEEAPAPIPVRETTGRHTLHGYAEVRLEREIAQAREEQRDYDMMALKLAMMEGGAHPAIAEVQVQRLRRWTEVPENDHLVRVALKRA